MSSEQSRATRAPRFSAGLPALLHLDGQDHRCHAHNLSRSGLVLVGEIPLPDENEVRFTVTSSAGDLWVTSVARVVHAEANPEGPGNCIGLQFQELDENNQGKLESLIARVVEGMAPAVLEDLPRDSSSKEIRAALESIPLVHRVSLAKRGQPRHRELLLQDPHLQVIDALAHNPNLLLHEVVTVLRMPNILPHTLAAIAKDARWKANEQVRILIATHRNTPLPVAEAVVSGLRAPALQRVIQAPGLQPALKARLLRRR